MRKYPLLFVLFVVFVMTACNSPNKVMNKDLTKYDVENTSAEVTEDDFIFRLDAERVQYKEGELIELYGEIEYVGEAEEITIFHSESAIFFDLVEQVRDYKIDFVTNDIGVSTTLKRGEPYREGYEKTGGYDEGADKGYVKFMKDFLERDDFPPGYYVVEGMTDFSVVPEDDSEESKRYNIKAIVDFKVIESGNK